MIKFGFKIKTRGGTVVDNLTIAARDRGEAERRLGQMYLNCDILECREGLPPAREEALDLERAINMISRESDSGTA